jgi:antibiotic biosynthesis monooxygenase (ABM) superfamily enzyme
MTNGNEERKVSLTITVRIGSITQSQAQEVEDKIRDIADDYPGFEVSAIKSTERPSLRGA